MSEKINKRELLREKRKQEKRRKTMIFVIIVFAVVTLILAAALLPKLLVQNREFGATQGFSVGDPNAPVTVVEFSSYNCGYCKIVSEELQEDFFRDYVETGDVYFTYVNIPSNNEESYAAATASYCAAEQNMFYEYKVQLFTYAGYEGAFSTENLISYSDAAGLDTEDFRACLIRDDYAEAISQDLQFAQSVGLTGTPSFLINGEELVYTSELIPTVDALLNN